MHFYFWDMKPIQLQLLLILLLVIFTSCNDSKKQSTTNSDKLIISDTKQEQTPLEKSITRGKNVYNDFCMQCHLPNGKGVPGSFPPLAGSDWLTDKRQESIYAVKYGQSGTIVVNGKTYNNVMQPMGLSNQEVADVMNYIMNSWSNTQEQMVTKEEVEKVKK